MNLLPLLLVSCLCTLGGASFRAVDVWDRFYAGQEMAKPALRGASFGKPKDMMPSLPAIIHNVDSADIAPSVAAGWGHGANKKAHPSLANGWVSKGSSSVVLPKH